jgi:N utilization substance protein B
MTTSPSKSSGDKISARRVARERVMQTLYASVMGGNEFDYLLHALILDDDSLDDTMRLFAAELATKSGESWDEVEAILGGRSKNWDLSRLAAIDRAILHMAITEFLYFPDIPGKVTIDEAIEIAKRFSTAESGRFVNGLLDAVLEDLTAQGKITKRGRGLRAS